MFFPMNVRTLTILAAVAWLAACTSKGQETRVRELIDEAVQMAQRGDAAGLMDLTSGDFRVPHTGADRRQVRLRLRYALQRFRKGVIHYHRPGVDLDADELQAEVRFAFLVVRGEPPEGLGPRGQNQKDWMEAVADKARLMRITLQLRRDDDEWRVYAARVERFSGMGFEEVR